MMAHREKKCLEHAKGSFNSESARASNLLYFFLLITKREKFLSGVWATNIFNVNDESFPIYDWNQVWHAWIRMEKVSVFIVMLLAQSCMCVRGELATKMFNKISIMDGRNLLSISKCHTYCVVVRGYTLAMHSNGKFSKNKFHSKKSVFTKFQFF